MTYLNSLKYNGYNEYGCGTIALHNLMVWTNNFITPSLDKNLKKISKMIKENNHESTVKNLHDGIKKLQYKKYFSSSQMLEKVDLYTIKNHLKNNGSLIMLSFDEENQVGHYEFYRYENGLVYESDRLSSFRDIAKKINTNNKFNYTAEVWLIS